MTIAVGPSLNLMKIIDIVPNNLLSNNWRQVRIPKLWGNQTAKRTINALAELYSL